MSNKNDIPLNVQSIPAIDMNSFFPQLPTEFPPYYLCQFSKRDNLNNMIDNRNEAFVRDGDKITRGGNLGYEISPSATWRYEQGPKEAYNEFTVQEVTTPDFVNLGGRGDLFYGYARNIDVESDLKRINFRDDKCFDNNYKIDPKSPDTSLFRHKDIIVKDYLKAQNDTYRSADAKPYNCLDLNQNNTTQITGVCNGIYEKNCDRYFEVGPGFNLNQLCNVPQNPFNNMTKRRMIYTRNQNIQNPEKYM